MSQSEPLDVQERAQLHIRGVREAHKEEADEKARELMRETKKREADAGNPYPHKLRD